MTSWGSSENSKFLLLQEDPQTQNHLGTSCKPGFSSGPRPTELRSPDQVIHRYTTLPEAALDLEGPQRAAPCSPQEATRPREGRGLAKKTPREESG